MKREAVLKIETFRLAFAWLIYHKSHTFFILAHHSHYSSLTKYFLESEFYCDSVVQTSEASIGSRLFLYNFKISLWRLETGFRLEIHANTIVHFSFCQSCCCILMPLEITNGFEMSALQYSITIT